jgi:hypothetical protein
LLRPTDATAADCRQKDLYKKERDIMPRFCKAKGGGHHAMIPVQKERGIIHKIQAQRDKEYHANILNKGRGTSSHDSCTKGEGHYAKILGQRVRDVMP